MKHFLGKKRPTAPGEPAEITKRFAWRKPLQTTIAGRPQRSSRGTAAGHPAWRGALDPAPGSAAIKRRAGTTKNAGQDGAGPARSVSFHYADSSLWGWIA